MKVKFMAIILIIAMGFFYYKNFETKKV